MAIGDNLQPAYPINSHEVDWALYPFVAGGGSTSPGVATSVTRYTFWSNFDPFDVKNMRMVSENVSFQIFSDSGLTTPIAPYFIVDYGNDATDELITANLPTAAGGIGSLGIGSVLKPDNSYMDTAAASLTGTPPTSSAVSAPVNIGVVPEDHASTLTQGQTYYYVVTATVGGVESLPSTPVSFTPTSIYPSVSITWDSVVGASHYTIYRNTTNSFTSGNLLLSAAVYDGQPPYYLITTFTSQPADAKYQTDQGLYTLYGYHNTGYGFGGSLMFAQGFVPQQAQLTGIFLGSLFHTNVTTPSTYYPINIELWNSSHAFMQTLGTIYPTIDPSILVTKSALLTTDANSTGFCNNITYTTGDDGQLYWITLNQPSLKLNQPINVTPGATYYIVVRQATLSGTNYYSIGANITVSGAVQTRDPLYYYPFANAYYATDGSSSWTQLNDTNGKPITLPFVTQGNIGRFAVTYWWGNRTGSNTYWPGAPSGNEYQFIHLDYNQKI